MSKPIYRFAGVELDTARRQIRVGEQRREASPQVFETLEFFAKHGGQAISKDELIDALWRGRIVTDASITQAIRKARAALAGCGVDPAIIKTQHGHGYRLDARVEIVRDDDAGPVVVAASRHEAGAAEPRKRVLKIGAIFALVSAAIVTVLYVTEIRSWFLPGDPIDLLEETQSTVESTDAKVDELVRLLRDQAALAGDELDPASERTIRRAVRSIVTSVDARKQIALEQLSAGDADAAAASIVAVARDLDMASAQSVEAAAASWREAGAIYYTSNIEEAVRSYEAAYRLRPDDPVNPMDLAFAYIRAGRLDEAITVFEELTAQEKPLAIQARALRGSGMAHKLNGSYAIARTQLEQSLEIAAQTGDLREQGMALLQLGAMAQLQGEYDLARAQFETAVAHAEEIGDAGFLADSLNNLGILMALTDQFDAAADTLARVYDIQTDRQDSAGQVTALGNLGANALRRGDAYTAETYLLESVALGERLGWDRSIALDLTNLGSIAASREQYDLAQERLLRALEIAAKAGLGEIHPVILANMGQLASDRGDAPEACRYFREALPRLAAMNHNSVPVVENSLQELDCP